MIEEFVVMIVPELFQVGPKFSPPDCTSSKPELSKGQVIVFAPLNTRLPFDEIVNKLPVKVTWPQVTIPEIVTGELRLTVAKPGMLISFDPEGTAGGDQFAGLNQSPEPCATHVGVNGPRVTTALVTQPDALHTTTV